MGKFLGTVFKTTSNISFKFSTKPGASLRISTLVAFEINEKRFLGVIKSIERYNYLINQDEAVQLSSLFSDKPNLTANSIGVEHTFDDFIIGDVEIIGRRKSDDKIFSKPKTSVKIGTKVYRAKREFIINQFRIEKTKISIGNLNLDQDQSIEFFLDFNELISKHFCVLAMTGAGKSWTLAVLIEQITKQSKIPIVIFDPHGEYSSLAVKNKKLDQHHEIAEKITNRVKIYSIATQSITDSSDHMFKEKYKKDRNSSRLTINITDLEPYQIISILNELFELSEAQARVLQESWSKIRSELKNDDPTKFKRISEIISSSEATKSGTAKNVLYTKFKLFVDNAPFIRKKIEESRVNVGDIVKKGQISVFDLSGVQLLYQQAFVAVVSEMILKKRINNKVPPVLCLFEEAHRFIPSGATITASKKTLKKIAQEGRKFSMGLGILSQRPSRLDSDVLSQCNTQIILRLTNPTDQNYVRKISEYVTNADLEQLRSLTPGEAFIFGSATLLSMPIRIFSNRYTEHGGYTPDIEESLKKF